MGTEEHTALNLTADDFADAVEMLSTIPFFPSEPIQRSTITLALSKMVSSKTELNWLVWEAVNKFRDWEKDGGLAQLRGLFCQRYRPADGRREYCSLPGYTTADLEAAFQAREIEQNEKRLVEYRRQRELAPPEDREPSLLPAAKRIPAPWKAIT